MVFLSYSGTRSVKEVGEILIPKSPVVSAYCTVLQWIPKTSAKIPCAMKETSCFLERKAALKEQCWQLVFPCWELLVLVIVLVTHLQRRTT